MLLLQSGGLQEHLLHFPGALLSAWPCLVTSLGHSAYLGWFAHFQSKEFDVDDHLMEDYVPPTTVLDFPASKA